MRGGDGVRKLRHVAMRHERRKLTILKRRMAPPKKALRLPVDSQKAPENVPCVQLFCVKVQQTHFAIVVLMLLCRNSLAMHTIKVVLMLMTARESGAAAVYKES